MRARGINLQQILLGAALLAALLWNLAHAAEIKGLRVDTGPTGTRAELQLDTQAEFKLINLANPDRLVVDLPGSGLARGFSLPAAVGVVKAVRSGQPVPGTTRIVFDLASPVVVLNPRLEAAGDGSRLVLEWPGDMGNDPIARIAAAAQGGTVQPAASAGDNGAAPQASPPAPDPSAASAAATSRLIAGLPPVDTPPPAAVARAQSNPARSAPPAGVRPGAPSVPTTVATGVPARVASANATTAAAAANKPQPAAAGRPLVIAIDAGHGGQDPGAVGPTGKREKDITLAIARELARQINATPGLKAHLVRDADVFIPLNRRAQLARTAGADLFISIHADAAENRNAKGSSVYVLSLKGASSQRARWLADKENAADLIGGGKLPTSDSMLTNVLLDLTQSGQMKASEDAGNHILDGLKRIGNNHKPHIERANFAVLRTSDIPAMLVETAFLSNPEEEKRLIDPQFQANVARAVLDGVKTYFTSQPPPGTLFAARVASAQASSAAASGGSR
ncbi:N-acetylmuramoyl-L-alanine amidase [Luteimonas sp. MC1572]|uniref:N-acetylmuramoyl-L-alanine amidase n=1 Tax=Luteimonas sp. MC1572 TaxID=2799325 RepID=UPI0018F0D8ED|nr:N-acetylmuramoyl-L-alanine amidase [Luteimonas sp. MC1572]MBJ6982913.1 N-acetylmuramoyl-L-alanine amidase [Luteimonas sp. MC1572]QQO04135.1 N-acetylmuramoyl-L-alanine amidase [Luteimonas sp. MC1572]